MRLYVQGAILSHVGHIQPSPTGRNERYANMSTQFTTDQIDLIIGSAKEAAAAGRALIKAQQKAQGAYTGTISVALEFTSDPDGFDEAMGELFDGIRANTDGLARRVSAAKAKKGEAYVVPNALSAARSVIKGAFEFGVSFHDEDGEIRSFGGIRKDLRAAQQAEKDAERQPYEISRDLLVARLIEAAERLGKVEVDILAGTMCDALNDTVNEQVSAIEAVCEGAVAAEGVAEAA